MALFSRELVFVDVVLSVKVLWKAFASRHWMVTEQHW